jgi:hypothetical protein
MVCQTQFVASDRFESVEYYMISMQFDYNSCFFLKNGDAERIISLGLIFSKRFSPHRTNLKLLIQYRNCCTAMLYGLARLEAGKSRRHR